MTKILWWLALSVMVCSAAPAQQEVAPSTADGPLQSKPAPPVPDKDGAYRIGPGIVAPVITRATAGVYPSGISETDVPHICFVSAVIGADGVPKDVAILNPHASIYDQPAMDAVKQSEFQAGTLDGKPVPVFIYLRVPFFHLKPPIPVVLPRYPRVVAFRSEGQAGEDAPSGNPDDTLKLRRTDIPPVATRSVIAEYSEQARRERFSGMVLISMIVNEDGLPTDIKVVKSIGHGLDEKAVQAAGQYRFTPAQRDGKPVAVRITLEVSFRI